MATETTITKNKIHPHKFTLWVGIGSIVMMFAGLTSAYVVKRSQANWQTFEIPTAFWYSTIVILMSSATIHLSAKAFKERMMSRYRKLLTLTMILGLLFVATQYIGFSDLWRNGFTLQSSVSYSFLYVIVGLHGLHVVGGVIALVVMSLKAFSTKQRNYSIVPVELISTYWHFVDILWIYLLLFLIAIR
jgi:cytochrome c oxidase subunit 3